MRLRVIHITDENDVEWIFAFLYCEVEPGVFFEYEFDEFESCDTAGTIFRSV